VNVDQLAEALGELVLHQADPAEWGDWEILTWDEAGVQGRAGTAGFVIQERVTGRPFIIGVRERERAA
jgi:hypothetical protein